MAIDENLEEKVAVHRGRTRQNKAVPWLIRDDGLIFPNVPKIAARQNFRPYHGDPGASLEERKRYLAGFAHGRRKIISSVPILDEEAVDIGKMTKEQLIAFAMEEFAEPIDPDWHLNKIRAHIAKLAGLDPKEAQRPKTAGLSTNPEQAGA